MKEVSNCVIEAPKLLGEPGIGNIHFKNLGLLTKWWWKFALDDNSLWKTVA